MEGFHRSSWYSGSDRERNILRDFLEPNLSWEVRACPAGSSSLSPVWIRVTQKAGEPAVAEILRVSPELFSREEEPALVGEVLILWPGALVAYVEIESQMSTGLSVPASGHT